LTIGNTKRPILTPTQRRERNREEVRRAILDTAREVMREEGVAALNLNEVARRVGMKTPSLYEYFSGKLAIYDALYLEGVRLYGESRIKRKEQNLNFWEFVEQAIYYYLNFAYRNPDLYYLVFERPVPEFVPSEESMVESRKLLGNLNPIFQEAINKGVIKTDLSVEAVRDIFIVVLHGLTSMHMANEPDLPPGQGRFGSLIPAITDMLKTAWQNPAIEP
jgi:AcrR family transcriptional regulator